ncbi:hypothetical protein SEA_SIXAMA_38 [Gordonia phage Sixama]|uniref:Uncharacterized protein n=1 Tax=Gordonia phage Sixama TaxID=2653271 RepID=A0A5Q2F402_9CAUD|nr:hypothetical protein PP302_gp038 [Gordonia phage Sixama]QGF20217.1 hypothetical protein SEA_SIXAMA_38 [Gordonia phage Sixama]
MIKNWLGQTFTPGTFVYRGARDMDTSSYRIGVVEKVLEEKRKLRIHWLAEPARPFDLYKAKERGVTIPTWRRLDMHGAPSVDTVVHLVITELDPAVQRLLNDRAMQIEGDIRAMQIRGEKS